MTTKGGARKPSSGHPAYFFLSYAHSPPIADYPEDDPDRLVREFFGDLVVAVRRHASPLSGLIPGFFDQEIPVGSNWKESVRQALGLAQVFVPLYSARYLAKSWPGREWACFRRRVELAGLPDPERRFVPVLWAPLSETQDPPGLHEALALGADEPAYAENGLRALLKIGPYRDSYQTVLDLVAKQIVVLAENSPIRPSEVPDIDEMKSAFMPESPLAVFAIETAAPALRTAVGGRDPRTDGTSSPEWRRFPRQELPLAEYAKQVAERFDFKVEVSEIMTVSDPRTRRPGIILIDPWFIADKSGRSALESAVENLPRWVLPLLVLDQPSDARTKELADQVRDILRAADALPTESSRRGASGVSSLDEFLFVVRLLVTEAERQYLRYRSGQVPSPPSSNRPRLGRPTRPDGPASTPDSLGEAPDA